MAELGPEGAELKLKNRELSVALKRRRREVDAAVAERDSLRRKLNGVDETVSLLSRAWAAFEEKTPDAVCSGAPSDEAAAFVSTALLGCAEAPYFGAHSVCLVGDEDEDVSPPVSLTAAAAALSQRVRAALAARPSNDVDVAKVTSLACLLHDRVRHFRELYSDARNAAAQATQDRESALRANEISSAEFAARLEEARSEAQAAIARAAEAAPLAAADDAGASSARVSALEARVVELTQQQPITLTINVPPVPAPIQIAPFSIDPGVSELEKLVEELRGQIASAVSDAPTALTSMETTTTPAASDDAAVALAKELEGAVAAQRAQIASLQAEAKLLRASTTDETIEGLCSELENLQSAADAAVEATAKALGVARASETHNALLMQQVIAAQSKERELSEALSKAEGAAGAAQRAHNTLSQEVKRLRSQCSDLRGVSNNALRRGDIEFNRAERETAARVSAEAALSAVRSGLKPFEDESTSVKRANLELTKELESTRTALARAKQMSSAGTSDTHELFKAMMSTLKCTIKPSQWKDTVIAQCGHAFSKAGITETLKSRNRKCPSCKEPFAEKDLVHVYLWDATSD